MRPSSALPNINQLKIASTQPEAASPRKPETISGKRSDGSIAGKQKSANPQRGNATRDDPVAYWNNRLNSRHLAMAPGDWVLRRKRELEAQHVTEKDANALIVADAAAENARLIARVIGVITTTIIGDHYAKPRNGVTLDVSLGNGDLAAVLAPLASRLGWRYLGVDPCQNAIELTTRRLKAIARHVLLYQCAASEVRTAEKGPGVPDDFLDLVVWGRLGLHITDDAEWRRSLDETCAVLSDSGSVVLFETMQDFNKHLLRRNTREHTRIRSLCDYVEACPELRLRSCQIVEYCGEQIAITVWHKRAGGSQ